MGILDMFTKQHLGFENDVLKELLGKLPSSALKNPLKEPQKSASTPPKASPVRNVESVRDRRELVQKQREEEITRKAEELNGKYSAAEQRKVKVDEERHHDLVQHRDRRERRTLRSKVTKVLTSLPKSCTHFSKKEKTLSEIRRKEMLQKLNEIREKKGLPSLDNYQFDSDDEVDDRGNVVTKGHLPSVRYTPRRELRRVLSQEQILALTQDPTYYVQKKEYRKAVGELDRRSWDQLLQEDVRHSHTSSLQEVKPQVQPIPADLYKRLSPRPLDNLQYFAEKLSAREEQFEERQKRKTEEMMERARKHMYHACRSKSEAALRRLRQMEESKQQRIEDEKKRIEAKMRLAEKNASVEQLKKVKQTQKATASYEEHKDKVMRHQVTEMIFKDKIKTLNDMTNEYAEQFAQTLRQSRIMKKLEKVGSSLKKWQEKRLTVAMLDREREQRRMEKIAAIEAKLAHSESARLNLQHDTLQMVREFNDKHKVPRGT